MIVTEAIRSRRTIFRFKPDPISDDNLEEILLSCSMFYVLRLVREF